MIKLIIYVNRSALNFYETVIGVSTLKVYSLGTEVDFQR